MLNSPKAWRRALALSLLYGALALLVGLVGRSLNASSIGTLAYNLVQNGGSSLTRRTTINFHGAGVTASDSGGITDVNIPGGTSTTPRQITLIVGSSDITSTGTKACSTVENAGTISGVHLISNALPTGANLVVDVLKVAFGSYTGFASAMSITASDTPTITTGATNPRYSDTVLTGWTTAVSAGDVVCVGVNSAPTGGATFASLTLDIT